jgi:peptidoglycan hydrolase CwlO-like protein
MITSTNARKRPYMYLLVAHKELTDLDKEVKKIIKQLDQLDRTYSEFQGFIDAHTEHIGTLTRETQTIDTYNEVLERRISNQVKLYETLKIML